MSPCGHRFLCKIYENWIRFGYFNGEQIRKLDIWMASIFVVHGGQFLMREL